MCRRPTVIWLTAVVWLFTAGCAEIGLPFPDLSSDVEVIQPDAPAPGDTAPLEELAPVTDDVGEPPDEGRASELPGDDDTADDATPEQDIQAIEEDVGEPPVCTPCVVDDEYAFADQICVDYEGAGSYCGDGCILYECLPEAEGFSTVCYSQNEFGTCFGERRCQSSVLTACNAVAPAAEICDGKDNDCSGGVDEGFLDTDLDLQADCFDIDDDDDGINDKLDNCDLIANVGQEDLDDDEIGDACDPDIDGDGVDNPLDCDPVDSAVTVAETESCNGDDDDCDGETDEEDSLGCTTYYPDVDNDGAGDSSDARCLCAPTAVYKVQVGGDCNDNSSFQKPGLSETCDKTDNNCDGQIDEPNSLGCTIYYFDADGDGWYLAAAGAQCLCTPDVINKYSGLLNGDCNDQDPLVFPGSPETCDGLDNNCDFAPDDGCDDDKDGYCDDNLVYKPGAEATCPFGPGDCNDQAASVFPGAPELCDGEDTNCNPADDAAEGTPAACGPECKPCGTPPPGGQWECLGEVGAFKCVATCAPGKFCDDCSCDDSTLFDLGGPIVGGRVLYDPIIDTFRVAYYDSGLFRLRAISSKGALGNDVVAAQPVQKWTNWGVTQNTVTGDFVFAWTAYPDSSVRVGIADVTGNAQSQFVIADDLAGQLARQNVQIGWHTPSATYLVLWDETTQLGLDIRGLLLDPKAEPVSGSFQVIGGSGDQYGPVMVQRAQGKGYVVGFGTATGAASPPKLTFMDHSAGGSLTYQLGPDVGVSQHPQVWYHRGLERGIVQWLSPGGQYIIRLFGEGGQIGATIDLGGARAGAAFGGPASGEMRLAFVSAGFVRLKTVNSQTGVADAGSTLISELSGNPKVIGAASHTSGHGLVLWTVANQLRGRFVAP